jgi:hypothetical protein
LGPGGRSDSSGTLSKRNKVTNRLGLELGPGGGKSVVAIEEVKVFGCVLTVEDLETSWR